jgi:hypothetical protein
MRIKALHILALAAAVWLGAASTASADVHLTMQNGRVSIVAKDATIRQILTEWARVGQTKIVNVERIPGGPMTIELNNVTESHALEVLLRAMSGYIAAPRPVEVANLSRFDRIIVMPTLASARPATGSTPPPVFQQQAPQFMQQPLPADDDADDEPAPNVAVPPMNRGPVFNTFPQQPQFVNPQQPQLANPQMGQQPVQQVPNQPAGFPSAPPFGGVAVPGMVAPAPQPQPGQIPPQPIPPPRRPGGQ